MSDAEAAYPAADSVCSYEGCRRPAWRSCPEGRCLYHSPSNGDSDEAARLVWNTARRMAADKDAEECNFRGWHFPEDPDGRPWRKGPVGWFVGFHFEKPVLFDGATFSGNALFDDATFSEDASFKDATFSGDARFHRAKFSGDARFEGAAFSGMALFGGAMFSANAWFYGATFGGDAWFYGATFSADALFEDATFSADAWFYGATFSEYAGFAGATFSGPAEFGGATFSGFAKFEKATFGGNAWFDRATFRGDARFDDATFSGNAGFRGARFAPSANISFDKPGSSRHFHLRWAGETAYRLAKQAAQERGDYAAAGDYHYAEQCAIEDKYRRTFGRDPKGRPWRKAFWGWCIFIGRFLFGRLVYGYGERPMRPLFIALAVIVLWTGLYWIGGAIVPDDPALDPAARAAYEPGLGECLYCSIVTFTTLGYGDYQPKEPYRLLAASEALLGAALMAVFIVCLSKKYVR